MNPQVELNSRHNEEMLLFTLSGVNVSLANAIRRTILSDIPLVVFRTTPYEQNKANIIANTSRLNNEILKQRLSCIPIHIKDVDGFPLKNYQLEVNVENITDTMMYVTTENFVINDLVTGKPIDQAKNREIFPADDYTGYFIDFVRLRPKISEELPGEKIHLTCELSIGTAKEDGMFNSVSTCSYGYTVDSVVQEATLEKLRQKWKDEGKNADEVNFEAKNWKLLDGMRITKQDSFDFIIQSVGIFDNIELVQKACEILIDKLQYQDSLIEKDELVIEKSQNTMANSYDIILENEDYTIGKVLEYLLYTKFYEPKILTFCGFKKMHPHDSQSIIRVAYRDPIDISTIKGNLKECIEAATQIFTKVRRDFARMVKK
jgi:DNA-directed RNA polymerase subunit L/phenylpyruvate tautomerase PptA (4-oxalocrotonate tautomerase family)